MLDAHTSDASCTFNGNTWGCLQPLISPSPTEGICWSCIAKATPVTLGLAAGIACTVATEGACAPLAVSAFVATIGKAAHDDGIVGNGKARVGRFAADIAIAALLEGASRAAEWASSPTYTRNSADQRQLRGVTSTVTFILGLLQSSLRGAFGSALYSCKTTSIRASQGLIGLLAGGTPFVIAAGAASGILRIILACGAVACGLFFGARGFRLAVSANSSSVHIRNYWRSYDLDWSHVSDVGMA
jgi:hypothetical protein